ncbi:MAG TPA: hypothetical protein VF234_10025, partial [Limnochordia bacterium]
YRAVHQIDGIAAVEAAVEPVGGGIDVRIAIDAEPDRPLPSLLDEIQARVDRYLRETVGVPIGSVEVEVRDIAREGSR